jgi:hypothetical protein
VTPGETGSSCSKLRPRRAGADTRAFALLALALAALLGSLLPAAVDAATPAQILALLNRERTRNEIPAAIAENPAWTSACLAHDAYEHANSTLSHTETEGKLGYSAAGNLIAQTSVLAQGIEWGPGDPYDNAPFHLFDLLNPRISSSGAADSEGFGCVEIELGTLRSPAAAVSAYSYPGNHKNGVPFSQRADEQPETPGQTLGLGTRTTGPNMFVYFDGPWTNGSRTRLTSATISSAHGGVAVRWLDNTSSDLLAPTGAILVPVAPLRPATGYTVHVAGSVTGIVPGSSIEQALPACAEEPSGSVSCGQPPATACVEEFATQLAVCGLTRTWAVSETFSFTTSRHRRSAG